MFCFPGKEHRYSLLGWQSASPWEVDSWLLLPCQWTHWLGALHGSGSEHGCSCEQARLRHLQQTFTVAGCLLPLPWHTGSRELAQWVAAKRMLPAWRAAAAEALSRSQACFLLWGVSSAVSLTALDAAPARSSPERGGLFPGPWLFLAGVRWLAGTTVPWWTGRKPEDGEDTGQNASKGRFCWGLLWVQDWDLPWWSLMFVSSCVLAEV